MLYEGGWIIINTNEIKAEMVRKGYTQREKDGRNRMELSEKMVEYRAKHNLTQKKLAELCGITVQTVVKAEQGKPLTRLTKKKIELAIKEKEG